MRTIMSKLFLCLVIGLFTSALTVCAAASQTQIAADLFQDQHFAAPSVAIDGSEIFRANAAMERFIANDIHHFIFSVGNKCKESE
jgi:predicted membrane chloride channel (bestrophin family)